MTFNELIKDAHSYVKDGGWWDEERNTGELLMLIVSECGEALEAHRNRKIAKNRDLLNSFIASEKMMDSNGFVCVIHGKPRQPSSNTREEYLDFKGLFELMLKDTFEDELADIVIRLADLAGFLELKEGHWDSQSRPKSSVRPLNIGEELLHISRLICELQTGIANHGNEHFKPKEPLSMSFDRIIQHVWWMCYDIDLWKHIELKMAYNRNRPHKHGKAY